ncbi:MAG: putative type II secretion system protein HxcR [Deltaproteobacteria bacterium]|jgi:type IV pilus assembly protein PilB|nr:putative type II secretion system protein HxcR [Deltaproteobacteria bacterium]
MGLLEELVQEKNLDPEVISQSGSTYQNLSELEKIQHLIQMDLLDETHLLQNLSKRYSLPLLSTTCEEVQNHEIPSIAKQLFKQTGILPIRLGSKLAGLLSVQSNWLGLNMVAFHLGQPVCWYLAQQQQIEALLESSELPTGDADISATGKIHQVFEEAILRRCSDIHLEPEKNQLRVRFRIDGYLQDTASIPLSLKPPIFSRIKLLAGMDIAIKRQPQDGHYTFHSNGNRLFDVRVSTIPGQFGEKLVLRLLDQTPVQYKLEALGFFKNDLEMLYQASQAPSGLILMVGPTGSGKTTTLYAILNALNSQEKNIITIENPVEYHIEGITQVSVKPEQGLGFADSLRAALRQDPDVLLIGEIRDEETAGIAVKAALTGHLVLSTLHSSDAVTAIQRLLNLGIAPDLLAETLTVIVSQRLVRRVCTHHSSDKTKSTSLKNECLRCRGTGYSGRIPVYEILKVNSLIRDRIQAGETGKKLVSPGHDLYFHTMEQTAQRLTQEGLTDWKEVQPLLLNV